jgi:precorrin-8X/cobalt-precorrin-8 methylmutase
VPVPDHIKDPRAIYDASFAIVRAQADLSAIQADLRDVVVRLIHACGMPDIVGDLGFSADLVAAATSALAAGRPVLADCEMVASGITRKFLPAANQIIVTLNDPRTAPLAEQLATTRSAAAVDLWRDHIDGAVLVFGNAPTALFRALELVGDGARPAAILGFPVGFVGAAESKQALADHAPAMPFLTLHGTRGGSALASAALNALAIIANGAGEAS